MYDIVIVGASIAGSTTAYRLKSKGYSVLLIDKEKFPRDKPCGDGITTAMLRELPFRIPKNLLCEKINKVGIINYSNEIINFEIENGAIYTSPRLLFDDFLLNKAKKIGTEVVEGNRVVDIKTYNRGYKVLTTNGEYFGKVLIGADGFFSVVNNKSKIQHSIMDKKSQYRLGIRGYLHDKSLLLDKNTIEFYMDRSLIYGYGWLFPSKNGINIGVGGIPKKGTSIRDILIKFCNRIYKSREREFISDDLDNIRGHYIPIAGFAKIFAKNNILLIGDAAKLVDPFSGEGMQWAIKSGKIAANVIHSKLNQYVKLDKYYNQQIYDNIYKNLRIGLRAGNYLYINFERFFKIMKHNSLFGEIFSKVVVGEINYEYILRHFPKIIPKLIYNGLKARILSIPPNKDYFNSDVKSFYKNNHISHQLSIHEF